MRSLRAVVFCLAMMAPLPAAAYTQADADACTPDAFRLCLAGIPDATRVQQCLERNLRRLSPACKDVFTRPERTAEGPRRRSRHHRRRIID